MTENVSTPSQKKRPNWLRSTSTYARAAMSWSNSRPRLLRSSRCPSSSKRPTTVSKRPLATCANSSPDSTNGRMSPSCRARFTPRAYMSSSWVSGSTRTSLVSSPPVTSRLSPTIWTMEVGERAWMTADLDMLGTKATDDWSWEQVAISPKMRPERAEGMIRLLLGFHVCAVNEMLERESVEIGEINNIFVRVVPDSIRVQERWLDLFGFSSEWLWQWIVIVRIEFRELMRWQPVTCLLYYLDSKTFSYLRWSRQKGKFLSTNKNTKRVGRAHAATEHSVLRTKHTGGIVWRKVCGPRWTKRVSYSNIPNSCEPYWTRGRHRRPIKKCR